MVLFDTQTIKGSCCVHLKNDGAGAEENFPRDQILAELSKQTQESDKIFQKNPFLSKINNSQTEPKHPTPQKTSDNNPKERYSPPHHPQKEQEEIEKTGKPAQKVPNSPANYAHKGHEETEKNSAGKPAQNVTTENRNAFDTPELCPQGSLKDHSGDCTEPF